MFPGKLLYFLISSLPRPMSCCQNSHSNGAPGSPVNPGLSLGSGAPRLRVDRNPKIGQFSFSSCEETSDWLFFRLLVTPWWFLELPGGGWTFHDDHHQPHHCLLLVTRPNSPASSSVPKVPDMFRILWVSGAHQIIPRHVLGQVVLSIFYFSRITKWFDG